MSTVLIAPNGDREVVPDALVPDRIAVGYTRETAGDQASAAIKGQVEGDIGVLETAGQAAGRTITFGGTDVLQRGIGGEDARRHLVAAQEANPLADTVGTIGGAVLPMVASGGTYTPVVAAGKLGTKLATAAEGASALTRVGKAALGYGVEGGLQGLGQGVSELALSDDPLTLERIGSTLSSNALYGGAIGAGAGTVAKTAEIGLGRARTAIENYRAGREAIETLDDDLARMDPKQLVAARKAEVETIKAAQKAEVEAAEVARAADRRAFSDELNAFRREMKEQSHALTTKDIRLPAVEGKWATAEIGKVASQADKQLDRLLNNPIALASNPTKARAALDALQQQENVYTKLLERGEELRAVYGTDALGVKRAAALDTIPTALEKNRALQARIEALNAPIKPTTPDVSPRLQKIDEAREVLSTTGRGEKSIGEQMLAGSMYSLASGAVVGAAEGSPLAGLAGMAAPFIGAKASRLVGDQVFGRLGKAGAEAATRGAKAVSKFLEVGERAARAAPPVATRVLASVRFAEGRDDDSGPKDLPGLFKRRSEEIRSQTAFAPDGSVKMRPEARQAVADRLVAVKAVDPIAADKLETLAARRIEFLASKLPRRPDIAGMPLGGPDRWRPSDMEIRRFARYVAAVEDPMGIVERLGNGTVTLEDAEALRAVYPELHRDITQQLVSALPDMRQALPYHKRLGLSLFAGVPVDPSFHPQVLGTLQAQFATEEGADSGVGPTAQAQFGSVGKSADSPTPAQERSS